MTTHDKSSLNDARANIYSMKEINPSDEQSLEAHRQISALLRESDQAILLPGSHYSTSDSDLGVQNVVYEFSGRANKFPHMLLNENWGHGVALVRLSTSAASMIPSSNHLTLALEQFRNELPNVLSDSEVHVGPGLHAQNAHDVGEEDWKAGFDSSYCVAGVYTAYENRPSYKNGEMPLVGTTRPHLAHYLVVRAGAGTAADEFHRYLMQSLQQGNSLSTALENMASQCGLNNVDDLLARLASAGKRNRAHLMLLLARAIGLESEITCALDYSTRNGRSPRQMAMLDLDTVTNVFERGDTTGNFIYFANAVAPKTSQGLIICSNLASGFFLYNSSSESYNGNAWARNASSISISNDVLGSMPFGPQRACSDHIILSEIEKRVSNAVQQFNAPNTTTLLDLSDGEATPQKLSIEQLMNNSHPDYTWCSKHFTWYTPSKTSNAHLNSIYEKLPPLSLWGTHAPVEPTTW